MPGELLLGVDIGTYSAKGVLCTRTGDVLATATVEHGLSLPRPGWAEHDAEAIWWGEFVAICRALLGDRYRGEDVGGVAVSAIGACLLPVDAAGRPLRPGILYGIDTRATAEIAWLNERFGEQPLFDLGGMALTSQAIGPKILWLRRHEPEIYARTDKLLAASSYMVLRLTGELVMDRHTASYYNPLIDIRGLEWDDRFAEPIVELERLPRLLWSTEIAGAVTPAAAAETGLAAGTPVTAGTIDAAAEAISVGVVDPGDMMVMYGTTMFFIHVTDGPVPDPRMWATAYLLPGLYGDRGRDVDLRRADPLVPRQLRPARAGGGGDRRPERLRRAGRPTRRPSRPAPQGLICLPYFAGERTPLNDPDARGVFAGLTLSHTRAHLYRASLEGTAYGVRHNLETMAAMGAPPRAAGRRRRRGARTRSGCRSSPTSSGLPQDVPERTIGASYGDAFLAGLGTGLVPGLDALARDWVKIELALQPREAERRVYDDYYRVYRHLYEAAKDDLHALARLGAGEIAGTANADGSNAGRWLNASIVVPQSPRRSSVLRSFAEVAMNITLSAELEELMQVRLGSGRYRDANEVVEEALRLLDERDRLAALEAELSKGLEQLDRGEGVLWTPEVMGRLKREATENSRLGKPIKDAVKPCAASLAGVCGQLLCSDPWQEVAMNVTLDPDLETMIRRKIELGLYDDAGEVVREALTLLEERDRLAVLRAELEVGFEQLARGEGEIWTPDVMKRLEQEADEDERLGKPIPDAVKP